MKLLWILMGLLLIISATYSVPVTTEANEAVEVHEEDGEASDNFLQEVREYFEQQRSEKLANRQARHATSAINHGDTIALQTFVRNYWLGCYGTSCGRYPCPIMMMNGNDWTTKCLGEVFKIYRASGPGAVCVGDLVGIYYPHESGHWLNCSSTNCVKGTCPGVPTTAHGFASQERWYICWASVFKIYAKGKNNGDVINA